MASKHIFPTGTLPPLGEVPQYMYAQVIRQDRLGEPRDANREHQQKGHLPEPQAIADADDRAAVDSEEHARDVCVAGEEPRQKRRNGAATIKCRRK